MRLSGSVHRTILALTLALGLFQALPAAAADDKDDVSTGRRFLGTAAGSIDGALAARAMTLNERRTPMILLAYGVAVGAGAGIGYSLADNDKALTTMGILFIPLLVVNLALPRTNRAELAGMEAGPAAWWEGALVRCAPEPAPGGLRVAPFRLRM
jgi:hypothetical protein